MMRSVGLVFALSALAHVHAAGLTDCRNQTFGKGKFGNLSVMSWHIHYNTNTTGQKLLYEAFMKEFYDTKKFPFPPVTTDAKKFTFPPGPTTRSPTQCPFGPNYADPMYPYVCSLEAPYDDWGGDTVSFSRLGGQPWSGPQRAFYFPLAYIDEAWDWVNQNRFHTDVLRHPNTGCMHDDHSVRANWTAEDPNTVPTISIANFPCNVPGTGCNDTLFGGPPACNCADSLPLPDDSPATSCAYCIANGGYVKDLTFACTEPALQVNYSHIKYYNGEVSCGNLFLESDIGGGINVAPIVKFPTAKEGTYYTFVMMDPDADLAGNGSWPDVTTPGSHAPVRHWVVGNLDATALTSGDFSTGTTVSAFMGPSPPWGSHRYGQFLFPQVAKMKFEVYDDDASKVQWDWKGFLATYAMSSPVASNWHITEHADPRSDVRTEVTMI